MCAKTSLYPSLDGCNLGLAAEACCTMLKYHSLVMPQRVTASACDNPYILPQQHTDTTWTCDAAHACTPLDNHDTDNTLWALGASTLCSPSPTGSTLRKCNVCASTSMCKAKQKRAKRRMAAQLTGAAHCTTCGTNVATWRQSRKNISTGKLGNTHYAVGMSGGSDSMSAREGLHVVKER